MSDLFRLDGKVAIITGSSRGIGRAIAEAMAAQGAAVMISSRNIGSCEEVAKAIVEKGGRAAATACNTGTKASLLALLNFTIETFGRLDHIVANVAVNPHYGPLSAIADDAWDKIMAVNVRSTLWLANMGLPEIARQGGGSFTVISSIGALRGDQAIPAYNVSKLAEIGLVQNLAVEWGPKKIRVNAILPGLTRTDFARALWENPAITRPLIDSTPLRRLGEVEDIGGVGAFFATDAARFITGQSLVVDGGSLVPSPFK